jgi:GMP synthase PP-ATPase subunit
VLNLTLLARWVNLLIGRLTRIQSGRRRSDKRKHVKFLVKQTVYKDFMEENQPQKVNSKSINNVKILICPVWAFEMILHLQLQVGFEFIYE